MLNSRIYFFCLVFFCITCSSHAIVISELVADNGDSLFDEDEETPDWIELYNPADSAVDLTGWYLTDDPDELTKWTFPSTTIGAKEFLIVFASDKDRAVAGQELHTNFKLSASGEYIALVQPDGTTTENGFSFPEQLKDISYGYGFGTSDASVLLAGENVSCKAHIPTGSEDASGWQDLNFDDSDWSNGQTGVGYERDSGYESLIHLDVEAMYDVCPSVYIRIPFEAADITSIASMTLRMKYDDGFVAYLNGTEIISANAPDPVFWNSSALGIRPGSDDATFLYADFDITENVGLLQEGENALAIHGLNVSLGSSDLLFVPRLEAARTGDINLTEKGMLSSPTPGMANGDIQYEGFIDPPVILTEHGLYDEPISVSISNVTADAEIRYTLNGDEPTEDSALYTGSINISSTSVLRAKAFKGGFKPSFSETTSYIFVDDVVTQSRSTETINGQEMMWGIDSEVVDATYRDASNQEVTVQDSLKAIPTLSVVTDWKNLLDPDSGIYVNAFRRWERPASVELINPDGSKGFQVNAGLRIRGGYSRNPSFYKHSFRLFFRSEYGDAKLKFALFEDEGGDEFEKVDLRTAQNYSWPQNKSDPRNTLLRDIFNRDSAGAMKQPYTRSRYYHLYLNGHYWGLYMTEERPHAHSYASSYLGGDREDYDVVKSESSFLEDGSRNPDKGKVEATEGTLDAYCRLFDAAMDGFADNADYFAAQGLDVNGDPAPSQERLLDVENLIDHVLIVFFTGASDNDISKFFNDAKLNNMYAIYNRANPDGFKWILHDCEHSMDTSTSLDRTGPYTHSNFTLQEYFNPLTLHDKLVDNEEYRIAFADRLFKHFWNNGAMVQTNCETRVDARKMQIDRAIVAHSARWGSTSLDRNTWVNAVATMREFLNDRSAIMFGYLDQDGLLPSIYPPTFSHQNGMVEEGTMISIGQNETGTVYYTIDGSDPRAIGGASQGSTYSAPIEIHKPTYIKARLRSASGEWSALNELVLWTPEIPLAISEVMYHAPEGSQSDFIEIRNITGEAVSLKGYSFDKGINFEFNAADNSILDAGEYAVVVKDIDAFATKYATNAINIIGEYEKNLSNSGESVQLEFKDNNLITFEYSDARNWPQAADGAGHSLIPDESIAAIQGRGLLDYAGYWRASAYMGGSPGEADPIISPSVIINEVTPHTDTGRSPPYDSNDKIELYNTSDQPVDLSGWGLSDNDDDLMKWTIPDRTTIPAKGFVVFDEDDFHPDRIIGFGLNKAGEQVYLSKQNRVVDSVRFKGTENGTAWGRYPDGENHWITTTPTDAAANQPANQQIRIGEIMYHPLADGSMEYLVITNLTSSSVQLRTEAGNWRIDGGISYDFPDSTSIGARKQMWLVLFDPNTEITLRNQFCTTYGLDYAQETILGPYEGKLSNKGERVAIERPQASDDPLAPFDVSWVVVDEVFYFDQTPWPPDADGTGYPLSRIDLSNWTTKPDTDGDLLPDSWEVAYFGDLAHSAKMDSDGDGYSNLDEYITGTDPNDNTSFFTTMFRNTTFPPTIAWNGVAGRRYSVYWTDDLSLPFIRLVSGIRYPKIEYQHINADPDSPNFYRIKIDKD